MTYRLNMDLRNKRNWSRVFQPRRWYEKRVPAGCAWFGGWKKIGRTYILNGYRIKARSLRNAMVVYSRRGYPHPSKTWEPTIFPAMKYTYR